MSDIAKCLYCEALQRRVGDLAAKEKRLRSVLATVRQTAADARLWLDIVPYDPRKDMHEILASIVRAISALDDG